MVSFIDLVVLKHWQAVYDRVLDELVQLQLDPPPHYEWMWPHDWLACSNDSYYERYGHHRNHWRQFDAVVIELQKKTQLIANEHGHDLDTPHGIRQWRRLLMPFVTNLQCFSCGTTYQKRVTIFSHDRGASKCECDPCIERVAAYHDQMYNDYLTTLSPRSREIEEGRQHRLKKRNRIPEQCEPRRRQRIRDMFCTTGLAESSPQKCEKMLEL